MWGGVPVSLCFGVFIFFNFYHFFIDFAPHGVVISKRGKKLMPKMIGKRIGSAHYDLPNNYPTLGYVKLTYAQAVLLPASQIHASLNTSDRGSQDTVAKRWYTWYASSEDILLSARSTLKMRSKASRCGWAIGLIELEKICKKLETFKRLTA